MTKRIARRRNDDGLTLVELVVAMFIMGLITILFFNIFQTTNETAQTVASRSVILSQTQLASQQIAKSVRNASSIIISTDGRSLTTTNAQGVVTKWRMSDKGLTNGKLTLEHITAVTFTLDKEVVKFEIRAKDEKLAGEAWPRLLIVAS